MRNGLGESLNETPSVTEYEQIVEEVVELIGTLSERGDVKVSEVRDNRHFPVTDDEWALVSSKGLFQVAADERVSLTAEGRRLADLIIRRHRVIERFLEDVLGIADEKLREVQACAMEHILENDVTDAVCTLLGHPRVCPHGKPIPPGECCARHAHEVKSVIVPASELRSGEEGRIIYIASPDHGRVDRLTNMGLFPGVLIRVHQTYPARIILYQETTLGLDDSVAGEIYVKRVKR
jgi:DtxR family Mn-dependent transcriptional regulator